VRITDDTRFAGRHIPAGQVIEVPEEEAHLLVIARKAEFVEVTKK
jgi:hypothetical protein